MNYTNTLLDELKAKFSLSSDYQLAKMLGVSCGRVSNWRKEKNSIDWEVAFQIADMLEIDDQNLVYGLLGDKYKNPRLISALQAGAPI